MLLIYYSYYKKIQNLPPSPSPTPPHPSPHPTPHAMFLFPLPPLHCYGQATPFNWLFATKNMPCPPVSSLPTPPPCVFTPFTAAFFPLPIKEHFYLAGSTQKRRHAIQRRIKNRQPKEVLPPPPPTPPSPSHLCESEMMMIPPHTHHRQYKCLASASIPTPPLPIPPPLPDRPLFSSTKCTNKPYIPISPPRQQDANMRTPQLMKSSAR